MTNNNNNNPLIIALAVILILAIFGGYGMMGFNGEIINRFSLLGIALTLISAIWVTYDVIVNNKRLSNSMKVLWIFFAAFFSIITAVIYYLIGRNPKKNLLRKNKK